VIQDVEDGLSEFPHVIVNQARIHDFYLDVMRRAPAPLEPDYSRRLIDLEIDARYLGDFSAHPLTARLERMDGPKAGMVETVRARYLVGCDGAHSLQRTRCTCVAEDLCGSQKCETCRSRCRAS
jgi:phenol 2-monooxygenase